MIGILFVVRPGVVTKHGVRLEQPEQEDQAANQLVPGYVAHAVIVVVEREIPREAEHAGLLGDLALIPQDVFTDRARLAHVIAHIIIRGSNHVARIAFLNQLGHRARRKQGDVIGMRLDRDENFAFVRRPRKWPLQNRCGRSRLRERGIELHGRQARQHASEKVAPFHKRYTSSAACSIALVYPTLYAYPVYDPPPGYPDLNILAVSLESA